MRHILVCVVGITACSVGPARCIGPSDAEGTEGRSVFSFPLAVDPSWPLAAGDRFSMMARSAADAPPLLVRSSDPSVVEVVEQGPRVLRCWRDPAPAAGGPCDPADPQSESEDAWVVIARGVGRADLRLENASGRLHDKVPLSVARVAQLDLVESLALAEDLEGAAALGSPLTLSLTDDPSRLLSVRARSGDGRLVGVQCSVRAHVDDPAVVSVVRAPDDALCAAEAAGAPTGPWFGVKAAAPGETRVRVTQGALETVLRIVVE
jgi:hypothetical protein